MAAKPKSKDINFEKALSELEALVSKMENGDLSLEESLKAFEQGVKLTRDCQTRLTEAEQRVQMLMEEQGELVVTEFDEDELEE